jgi:hypothetical protein
VTTIGCASARVADEGMFSKALREELARRAELEQRPIPPIELGL